MLSQICPFLLYSLDVTRCEQRKAEGIEAPSNQDDDYMIDESKLGPPFGIVINGHSLVCLLDTITQKLVILTSFVLSIAEVCTERGSQISAFRHSQSMQSCDMLQSYPSTEGNNYYTTMTAANIPPPSLLRNEWLI